ncbi:hypothetical protein ASPSYDRAFT_33173 [Aspergillus sydowii CBS 593.65]|uniref:Uncharacterized protein n=1 Tax=Aspergillus sydowii CBS 593.65 TaxID=1036612 RepID=A0A1L9TCM2_9EURO|nr:uncharacterized protein ASPSYDRAFT_33173 [Aspergillus sydowii CBS 593.65]OJJ57033.1 hypothetical protein ASPSYDRAFT_33173 [Aspergillus sydowii CBS 593.65]
MPDLTDAAQCRLSSRAAGVQQKREEPERQRTRNSSHFQGPSRDRETDHGDRNTGLYRPDQPIFREFSRCRVSVDVPALIRAFPASPAYHRCIVAHPMDFAYLGTWPYTAGGDISVPAYHLYSSRTSQVDLLARESQTSSSRVSGMPAGQPWNIHPTP